MKSKKYYRISSRRSFTKDGLKRLVNDLRTELKCSMWVLGSKLRSAYLRLVFALRKLRTKGIPLLTRLY